MADIVLTTPKPAPWAIGDGSTTVRADLWTPNLQILLAPWDASEAVVNGGTHTDHKGVAWTWGSFATNDAYDFAPDATLGVVVTPGTPSSKAQKLFVNNVSATALNGPCTVVWAGRRSGSGLIAALSEDAFAEGLAVYLGVNAAGFPEIWERPTTDPPTAIATATVAIPDGEAHVIGVKVTPGAGTGAIAFWVDGAAAGSFSGLTVPVPSSNGWYGLGRVRKEIDQPDTLEGDYSDGLLAAWNELLSDTDVAAITAEPFELITESAAGGAPTVSSATIDTAGTSLTITHSEAVSIGVGGNGGLTLNASGGAATLTFSSGAGTTALVYTISRTIGQSETVTLDYTQPGDGIEATDDGADVASYSGQAVTNNSTQAVTGELAFTSLKDQDGQQVPGVTTINYRWYPDSAGTGTQDIDNLNATVESGSQATSGAGALTISGLTTGPGFLLLQWTRAGDSKIHRHAGRYTAA